jgi:hypothetical protein
MSPPQIHNEGVDNKNIITRTTPYGKKTTKEETQREEK